MSSKKTCIFILSTIIVQLTLSTVVSANSFDFEFDKSDPIFRARGGTRAKASDWKFLAGLNVFDGSKHSFCVGSLIQKDWLLTTAHCIPENLKNVKGKIGISNLNDDGQVIIPKMVIPHPEYHFNEKTGYFNDIAMIKLESDVVLTDVELVLVSSEPVEVGSECSTASWEPEDSNYQLFQINQQTIDIKQCREILGQASIQDTNLCTIIQSQEDHCMGDMGSPLICNGVQIAIISWGLDCVTPRYPIVWTNLTSYLEWIAFTINEFSSEESYKSDRRAILDQAPPNTAVLDDEIANRIMNTEGDFQTKSPTKFPWQRSLNNVAFKMPMRIMDAPKFDMITEGHTSRRKSSYKSKLGTSMSVCLSYFIYLVMYFNYIK